MNALDTLEHVATPVQGLEVGCSSGDEVPDLLQRLQMHELLAEQHQSQLDASHEEVHKLHGALAEQQHAVIKLQQQLTSSNPSCQQLPRQLLMQAETQPQAADMLTLPNWKQSPSLQRWQVGAASGEHQLQQQLQDSQHANEQLQQQLQALQQECAQAQQRCELQEGLAQQLQGQLLEMTDQRHKLAERLQTQECAPDEDQENQPPVICMSWDCMHALFQLHLSLSLHVHAWHSHE